MSEPHKAGASRLKKEAILFGVLLAFGLLLLPVAIYLVGNTVFGDYGDGVITDFFASVVARLLAGDLAAVFLVLSPYLIWQTLRLSIAALRRRTPGA